MQALRYLLTSLLFSALALPAVAFTILRDAGIEAALQEVAKPVLRQAGLSSNTRILLVGDRTLNAFVTDHQHIFIHTGLLMKLETAEQFQAVIAHEAAHIANGHLARRAGNARAARTAVGLGMILAAAAAASGSGEAAGGIAIGIGSSANRMFLSHTRAEEASADQSSVRYMLRAGIDPKAAVEVHKIFRGQEALASSRQDPYVRSHPLSRDRVRAMQAFVEANGKSYPSDSSAAYWFARAKGKTSAFLRSPSWTLRRSGSSPSKDIRLMREAVAWHQRSNLSKALPLINQAIKMRPRDAFLHDLKAEILLKNRKAKAAAASYATASKLAPNNALIRGGYGRALLASGQIKSALKALEAARGRDFRDPRILRDLAVAYAKTGQTGMASLVTAERYALLGNLKTAGIHAKRASGLLRTGSGPWQRAEDVLSAAKRLKK